MITSKKRTLDRPFIAEPIRRLMKMDRKLDSTKDRETLIKVGVHISTILNAIHNSTPAVPRNMMNYTRNKLRINLVFCRTYTGRLLRFNVVLKTSPAPAMELIFDEFHKKLHCRLGPQQYIKGVNLASFCAIVIYEFDQEQTDSCATRMEAKINLHYRGP